MDADGIAQRGLLVRHLVLPNRIAGTEAVLGFIARDVSLNTYVNLMAQYRPCYRAGDYPELDRPITAAEFRETLELARRHGLHRLDRGAWA
jgi:putative pyruvate formate lyase activating enzyme